ncbi:hypothetical protein [Solimonas aquatica]|uniref:hypothetical protein n=1 Tax=Solimonas aquatica TaxID=489703 RepID=UPI00116036C8|nr:hypothetical protein [Solimonas aquatica]
MHRHLPEVLMKLWRVACSLCCTHAATREPENARSVPAVLLGKTSGSGVRLWAFEQCAAQRCANRDSTREARAACSRRFMRGGGPRGIGRWLSITRQRQRQADDISTAPFSMRLARMSGKIGWSALKTAQICTFHQGFGVDAKRKSGVSQSLAAMLAR